MSEQEKRYIDRISFLETAGFPDFDENLDISVVNLQNIPETASTQLRLYRNEFYEVSIAEGLKSVEFAIDGKMYRPNGAPFACFVAPNQLQSYNVFKMDEEVRGFFMYISRRAVKSIERQIGSVPFFSRAHQSYYNLSHEQFNLLFEWASLTFETSKSDQKQRNALMISYLTILLIKANNSIPVKDNDLVTKPERIVEVFLNQLESDLRHRSVQYYADRLALTTKQLNSLLRKVVNKTASRVIQDATVNHAKSLLLQSDKNVSEVAFELGFDELSNFSRLFKRVTGQSPRSFQVNGRN